MLEEYISQKLAEPSTASQWGQSFIEAFNKNKRGFYLSYVLGLESTKPRSKALRGTALHAAVESLYVARDESLDPAQQMGRVIQTLLGEWLSGIDIEDQISITDAAVTMALDWCTEVWLKDIGVYDVIESERLLSVPLPNGFPFTCRLDRTVRSTLTGKKRIRELKTTGWRLDEYIRRVSDGDQVTAYLWAETTFDPTDPPEGAEAEVTYAYGKSHRCARSELITRSKFELDDYADKLVGLYADLAGRLRLWPRVDPTHISLVWPGMYDESSVFEDEFVSLRRLHPKDLEHPAITAMYGFRINEQRRSNTVAFLNEWSKYDDGILGYMAVAKPSIPS